MFIDLLVGTNDFFSQIIHSPNDTFNNNTLEKGFNEIFNKKTRFRYLLKNISMHQKTTSFIKNPESLHLQPIQILLVTTLMFEL